MALDPTKIVNDPQNLGAIRARVAIDYSGGNQAVSTATSGAFASCRGIEITVAGDLVIIQPGQSTATTVPYALGRYGDQIIQVNQTGSTASGFYLF